VLEGVAHPNARPTVRSFELDVIGSAVPVIRQSHRIRVRERVMAEVAAPLIAAQKPLLVLDHHRPGRYTQVSARML
jgi:hypothetical protein